jgi:hypothetical protein
MPSDYRIAGYPDNLRAISLTILSGTAVTEMFATQGWAVLGVIIPAAWTAAVIGQKICLTGNAADLVPVINGSYEQTATITAASFVPIPWSDTAFAPFMALTSIDTTGAAVNQGADRSLIVILRKYLN